MTASMTPILCFALVVLVFCHVVVLVDGYTDIPCQWKSLTGASYDLQPLRIRDIKKQSYTIVDGDIPCTPETEATYSFAWNFCADVTNASLPANICKGKDGAAIQYVDRADGYQECEVIGHYDPLRDDTYFSILDEKNQDPSKGIAMKYLFGNQCPDGHLRTATVEVECANTEFVILSALEPEKCQYHMTMQSMYGCPLECPITAKGLCNSHGHCAYDKALRTPYCYCNEGYGGPSCLPGSQSSSSGAGSAYGAEMGLMVTLMIIMLVLVGFVAFAVVKVGEFRKEQANFEFRQMSTHETEMIDHTF